MQLFQRVPRVFVITVCTVAATFALAFAEPAIALATCPTGTWSQATSVCATSISAGNGGAAGTFMFTGCYDDETSLGSNGNLWTFTIADGQSEISSAELGGGNPGYNTTVFFDEDQNTYLQTAQSGDYEGYWWEWPEGGSSYTNTDYYDEITMTVDPTTSPFNYWVATYESGTVYANLFGAALPAVPSSAYVLKIGMLYKPADAEHVTVTCGGNTYNTVWVMTSAASDNIFWYSVSGSECTEGTWEKLDSVSQTALDIASFGNAYLGSDGNIFRATDNTCLFTPGDHTFVALSEDTTACITAIDGDGEVWLEESSCGL
jgi:hypothetical protein